MWGANMTSRISGSSLSGKDGRHTHDLTALSWSPLRVVDIPLSDGYDGLDRRFGKGRRGFERRFESRADSMDRRGGLDRREGHWRCQSGC